MSKSLPPFSCTHTPEMPDLLAELGCTLVLSTYQAGKVIFISADRDGLIQLPREFQKPMGVAVREKRLAIATRNEVIVLADTPVLTDGYPERFNKYDGLFVPRAVYFCGELDLHDIAFSQTELYAVNTRFSCISRIDERYSFQPLWQPPFISALTPDDRCHLNGMAMADGKPLYATALGKTDTAAGWRANKLHGGVLMHVPSNEILFHNLPMPHSPRIFDHRLYFLNSANGELMTADPSSRTCETVNRVPGFARGLARQGDYLFVGVSRIRPRHMFGDMPIADQKTFAGIVAVHLPSGRLAGSIQYLNACEEIYDVQVLPGLVRPGILNHTSALHRHALSVPGQGFWNEPARRNPAGDASSESPEHKSAGQRQHHAAGKSTAGIIPAAAVAGALLLGWPQHAALAAPTTFTEQSGGANPLNSTAINGFSAPVFVDIDADGDFDVFISDYLNGNDNDNATPSQPILFYRNTGTEAMPVFELPADPNDNPLKNIPMGIYDTPCFADIDNDGDFDLFVGEDNTGTIKYYENTSTGKTPAFTPQPDNNPLSFVNRGSPSAPRPTFVDIDNDGDLDLFLGEYYGTVLYYKNTDQSPEHNSPTFTAQTGNDNPLRDVSLDFRSVPTFADLDNDGDLDALVGGGTSIGVITYWENTNTAAVPAFTQRTGNDNPFNNLLIPAFPSPALVDIDNDTDADVFTGNFDGTVNYFRNNYFLNLRDAVISMQIMTGLTPPAPAYKIDVNGDGKTDMAELIYTLQKNAGIR